MVGPKYKLGLARWSQYLSLTDSAVCIPVTDQEQVEGALKH